MGREKRTKRPGAVRRRLARWLDPGTAVGPPILVAAPATPATPAPPDRGGESDGHWPDVLEMISLRILSAVYQTSGQLESMEDDEQDAGRLEKLYRIDHAITRVRRHAENMQVLAGRPVEDADRQVTPLLDVVRAAASAIDHYQRVQVGRIAELAVVEFAADDVMRVLTELLDNATRFSPPHATTTVSAHLTEQGSVLLRVEDTGVGLRPENLSALNALLSGEVAATPDGERAAHLGLMVVARLAAVHQLRVHLTNHHPGGTTATVLLPTELLCEVPAEANDGGRAPTPRFVPATHRSQPTATRTPHLVSIDSRSKPAPAEPSPAPAEPELPRRIRASLRDDTVEVPALGGLPDPAPNRTPWYDDVAAFAAGTSDTHPPVGRHHEGQSS